MRWGYDGGGFACGPVEGNTIVEILVTGNDGHNYFVVDSRMSEFEKITISPIPFFDLLIHMNHYDVDFEYELEKCKTNVIEDYDYEISDAPEEKMNQSDFAKVIQLVRFAMQNYFGNDDEETDAETAKKFITPYTKEELEELEIPKLAVEAF